MNYLYPHDFRRGEMEEKMKKSETETPQNNNKPLFEEEEREKLIKENLTEEEVENLEKEGFNRDQIAYVAKEKASGEKFGKILDILTYLLPWITPID